MFCSEEGGGRFSQVASDRLQENGLKLHQGGLNWISGKKKKNTERVVFALEQAAQGSGGLVVGLVVLGGSWT